MRKTMLPLLLYIMLASFTKATAASEIPDFDYSTAAREAAPETLSAIRRLQESGLLRGDFRQQKNLKILKQPFVSRGWFIFSRQNGIYWEITEPLQNAYLIGKKGIRPAADGPAATVESPFADSIGRLFSSILGADLEELRNHFDLYYRRSDAYWQIGLKPRNRHVAAFISGIEITGNRYIDALKIVEAGGDTTEIAFTAILEELPAGLETRYFNDRQ